MAGRRFGVPEQVFEWYCEKRRRPCAQAARLRAGFLDCAQDVEHVVRLGSLEQAGAFVEGERHSHLTQIARDFGTLRAAAGEDENVARLDCALACAFLDRNGTTRVE